MIKYLLFFLILMPLVASGEKWVQIHPTNPQLIDKDFIKKHNDKVFYKTKNNSDKEFYDIEYIEMNCTTHQNRLISREYYENIGDKKIRTMTNHSKQTHPNEFTPLINIICIEN